MGVEGGGDKMNEWDCRGGDERKERNEGEVTKVGTGLRTGLKRR